MHKIILNLFILFAFIFMASSCQNSRGISVTKRHYSKGNYVSVSKKHKPYVKHETTKKEESPKIQNELETITAEVASEEKSTGVEASEKVAPPTQKAPNRLTEMINTAESEKTKEAEFNSNTNALSKIKKGNGLLQLKKIQPNGEARSLFWLVITILLIIWLVALISGGWGLGGLVNILLVIALILFILWLLRLI